MSSPVRLKRLGTGSYASADGRFTITRETEAVARGRGINWLGWNAERFWLLSDTTMAARWGAGSIADCQIELDSLAEARALIASQLSIESTGELNG